MLERIEPVNEGASMSEVEATTTGATTSVLDRTLDADAHEMVPSHLWGEVFGEASGLIGERAVDLLKKATGQKLYNPELNEDTADINEESVWQVRGSDAPASFDLSRRPEVLDVMGIRRQLIFPSSALLAMQLLVGTEGWMRNLMDVGGMRDEEFIELGRTGLHEYNDWVVRTTAVAPDRLRPVAYLDPTLDVSDLESQCKDLISQGVRAVHMNAGLPPGRVSPADPALDPVWSLLADNDIAATIHLGGEQGFVRSGTWVKAPAFAPGRVASHEIGMEPYSFATLHFAPSNWLVCMILGGVFERHPRLRFGVIEYGSKWFGPLIDSLDMWAKDVYNVRLEPFISMLPSEYAARNIRVTPFNNFEKVADYIAAYPALQNCYCFSTDYPHIEGGKDVKRKFAAELEPLGPEAVERFFVTNAELLLPD
jgi:predicted TIM-barrel fold metal-dependent hydrolase